MGKKYVRSVLRGKVLLIIRVCYINITKRIRKLLNFEKYRYYMYEHFDEVNEVNTISKKLKYELLMLETILFNLFEIIIIINII